MKKWVITLALIGSFFGCGSNATVDSKEVNEAKIFQYYSIDYDPSAKELTLFAQFTLGNISGTTIRLTEPGAVTVDSQEMSIVDGDANSFNLIGTYYRKRLTAAPSSQYVFKWTRTDGKVYENTLSMARPLSIVAPTAGTQVSKSADLVLSFEGDGIRDGETVFFDVISEAQVGEGLSRMKTTSIRVGKQGTISKADLANLVVGPAKIYARRLRMEDAQQVNEGVGGKMFSSAKSTAINVVISN